MIKRAGLWYHGWNVVAMCVAAQTVSLVLIFNCLSMFMPAWTKEFGVPVSTLALGVTFFSLTTAAICYLIGVISSRYSPRAVFGTGLVLLAAALMLVAAAREVWQILVIYGVIVPFAVGFCGSIPSQGLVSRWFVRRVGLAMGLTAAGLALPGLVFPPIILALLRVIEWRAIWGGLGVIVLVIVLPVTLYVFRERTTADDAYGYVPTRGHEGASLEAGEAFSLRAVVSRRNFWVILTCFVSVQIIPMMLYVNITPIVESYGASAGMAGAFLMTFSVTAMLAKLTAGWLADRIGNRLPFAVAAFGAGAGALLLAVPNGSPAYLVGVAAAIGLSGATWTLLASSILAEFGPATFGRAFGLAASSAPLATLSAPIVAKLQEMTGSYAGPLTALGAISIAASVGFLMLFRRQPVAVALPAG